MERHYVGELHKVEMNQLVELPNKILGVEVEDDINDLELLLVRNDKGQYAILIRESSPYCEEALFANLLVGPNVIDTIDWSFYPAPDDVEQRQ